MIRINFKIRFVYWFLSQKFWQIAEHLAVIIHSSSYFGDVFSSSFMKCAECKHCKYVCRKVARKHNSQQINCLNKSNTPPKRVGKIELPKYFHVIQPVSSAVGMRQIWNDIHPQFIWSTICSMLTWNMNERWTNRHTEREREKSQPRTNGMLSSQHCVCCALSNGIEKESVSTYS